MAAETREALGRSARKSFPPRWDVGGPVHLGMIGIGAIALLLALFVSVQAGIVVLAAVWVALVTWYQPKQFLFFLLFVAPLLPILKSTQTLSIVTPFKDVIILLLFFRVVVLPVLQKRDFYRENTLLIPILALVLWAGVGLLQAESTVVGMLRLRDILLYIPMLWSVRALVKSRDDARYIIITVLVSGGLVLILAALQFVFFSDGMVLRFDPVREVWIPRASSTLAHPNNLASYLLFLVPLAISSASSKIWGKQMRWLIAILGVVGLLAAYATYSRSGWIAMAVALVTLAFLFLIRGNIRRLLPIFFGIVLFTSLVVVSVPRTRILLRTIVDPTYASNEERLGILSALVASSTHFSAIFGRGLGDVFEGTLRDIHISVGDIVATDTRAVHVAKARTFVDNAVLKTWIELGIVGFVLSSWVVLRGLLLGIRVLRSSSQEEGVLGRSFVATTLALVALSFFLDVPEVFPVALLWWTFIGVLQALPYAETQRE